MVIIIDVVINWQCLFVLVNMASVKLIILYPIDLKIIFGISLLQPGPPKYVFLATPLMVANEKAFKKIGPRMGGAKKFKYEYMAK